MGFVAESADGAVITVRAQPRSARAGIDGVLGDALKVRIHSAPVDGKANRELIETLADSLGLSRFQVVFKAGESSKNKRLLVPLTVAEVHRRLGI